MVERRSRVEIEPLAMASARSTASAVGASVRRFAGKYQVWPSATTVKPRVA
jgi:hypothetical protein